MRRRAGDLARPRSAEPCAPDRIIKDFTELTDLETLLSC